MWPRAFSGQTGNGFVCGLLCSGGLTLLSPWSRLPGPILVPALGCLQYLHTQWTCSQWLLPAGQALARVPRHSERSRPTPLPVCTGRVGFLSLSVISTRLPAPPGCAPNPITNSAVNGRHSLPQLQLATAMQPGKGDLSLPQACKH